jgi:hypothetical protein
MYASSSFLGSLGSLIELVKKKRDTSLKTPWEAVPAERAMCSKLYGKEVSSPLPGEHHIVAQLNLTRIFVYVNQTVRL